MFRKHFQVSASKPLKGSDVRKLRADLLEQFSELDAGTLDLVLPAKASIRALRITQAASIDLVYSRVDEPNCPLPGEDAATIAALRYGQPLFFKLKTGLVSPTLYAVWTIHLELNSRTVFPVFLVHWEVSRFLLKGADLMLPGVYKPLNPTVAPEEIAIVMIRGNPMPGAVGISEVSHASHGTHGKAMSLCHSFNDELWSLGSKWIPNAGFKGDVIELDAGDSEPPVKEDVPGSAKGEETNASNSRISLSQDDIDRLLVESFLQACKTTAKKDSVFPLEASKFFNDYLLPCRPDKDMKLDIKASSFKKVGVFLRAMDKRGLCKVKEVHGQLRVLRILRNCSEYRQFQIRDFDDSDEETPKPKETLTNKQIITGALIEDVYRLSSAMVPVAKESFAKLADVVGPSAITSLQKRIFTREELDGIVEGYISRQKLICNPPVGSRAAEPHVKLDYLLTDALFAASKKSAKPNPYPETLPVGEVRSRFFAAADVHHRVSTPGPLPDPNVKRGRIKPITIILEDRQGGRKHVTRASGFEAFRIDVRDFASLCQTQFACSATTSELPGKTKSVGPVQYEVHIQGDFLTELRAFLSEKCAIRTDHIELVNRSKSNKKK